MNPGLPDQKLSPSSQLPAGKLLMEENPSSRAGSLNVTASHWMKHGDRVDTPSSFIHPLGGFRAEYGGHQRLQAGRSQDNSTGFWASPTMTLPTQLCSHPATLPLFASSGASVGFGIPQPPPKPSSLKVYKNYIPSKPCLGVLQSPSPHPTIWHKATSTARPF